MEGRLSPWYSLLRVASVALGVLSLGWASAVTYEKLDGDGTVDAAPWVSVALLYSAGLVATAVGYLGFESRGRRRFAIAAALYSAAVLASVVWLITSRVP